MTTYYVREQGAVVRKADERLVVTKDDRILTEIPIVKADQLVIMGNIQLTTPAVALLLQSDVDVVFMSQYGKMRGRLMATGSKFAELRLKQLQAMSNEKTTLALAQVIVVGKLTNQRTLAQREARATSSAAWRRQAEEAVRGIEAMIAQARAAKDMDTLRGFEGKAGAWYWRAFRAVLQQDLGFKERIYHPSPDPVNALLSFGYALLQKDITAMVQLVGLDPYLGFFHTVQYGRPSLALDLMEEFRPIIVDPVALYLINHKVLTQGDFIRTREAERPVVLSEAGGKRLIQHYEERVNTRVRYPLTGEQNTYRRIFELQVRQMARCVQGLEPVYRPMTMD